MATHEHYAGQCNRLVCDREPQTEQERRATAQTQHAVRLFCGCPLDSGCDGYHAIQDR